MKLSVFFQLYTFINKKIQLIHFSYFFNKICIVAIISHMKKKCGIYENIFKKQTFFDKRRAS